MNRVAPTTTLYDAMCVASHDGRLDNGSARYLDSIAVSISDRVTSQVAAAIPRSAISVHQLLSLGIS